MAQTLVTEDGTLIIPGAYAKVAVVNAVGGVASTGVVVLVGEAETGNSYADEDPTLSGFDPTQFGSVQAKYSSGPLVDAFRAAAAPSQDPVVTGSPSRIYCLKTNPGVKASVALTRSGLTAYGTLRAKKAGSLGNLIYTSITQAAEVSPVTTATVVPNTGVTPSLKFRVNGGTEVTTVTAVGTTTPAAWLGTVSQSTPVTTPAAIFGNAGIMASGCVDRVVHTAGNTITVTANSTANITVGISGTATTWTNTPSVGDTLYISGVFNANTLGYYVVTAVTPNGLSATKLHNAGATAVTNPTVTESLTPSVSQFQCFSPLSLQNLAGTNRAAIPGSGTLTGTGASGSTITVTYNGSWTNQPQVNDIVFVRSATGAEPYALGLGGWSRVVSSTSNAVVLTKIDGKGATNFAAYTVTSADDFKVYRPGIDGLGKSIEIYSTSTAGYFYSPTTFGVMPWDVTGGTPVLYTGTEATTTINVNRQSDYTQESFTVGGKVVLKIGYAGTTCSVAISATQIALVPTGGSGSNQVILFKDFATLKDLAVFINSKTGFSCSVGANAYNQLSPTVLDRGTFAAASSATTANQVCLLKADAYFTKLAIAGSSAVEFSVNPTSGLPDPVTVSYLASGSKGATTDTTFSEALVAAEKLTANFVVPLFSRDATSDIADSLTEATSTYTIAGVHAATLDHTTRMSAYKKRRPRQAFLSIRDTYLNAKDKAQNLAAARATCAFQDYKGLNSSGSVAQFQPWYTAAIAAGFQAAAGYRGIFNKQLACSGVLQAAQDWFASDEASVEDALQAGLLVVRQRPTGGFSFVSDQTTYGVDNNFVYNSIQAIYAADVVSQTIAQQMENAFVGQSFSDINAAIGLSYLKGILADLKRLKWITGSDDAPTGYKNPKVTVSAPAMYAEVEVKLGTLNYFMPIKVNVSQVQQSAQG